MQFAGIAVKHPKFRKQNPVSALCITAECYPVEAWGQDFSSVREAITMQDSNRESHTLCSPYSKGIHYLLGLWLCRSRAEFSSKPTFSVQLVVISVLSPAETSI